MAFDVDDGSQPAWSHLPSTVDISLVGIVSSCALYPMPPAWKTGQQQHRVVAPAKTRTLVSHCSSHGPQSPWPTLCLARPLARVALQLFPHLYVKGWPREAQDAFCIRSASAHWECQPRLGRQGQGVAVQYGKVACSISALNGSPEDTVRKKVRVVLRT